MTARSHLIKAVIILASAISLPGYAKDLQASEVPQAVRQYVEQTYPQSSNIEWDYDKDDGYYEADFKRLGNEIEVKLTKDGQLIVAKEDIEKKDIPELIQNAALKQFPKARILGANRIIKPNAITWDVGLKLDNGQYHNAYYSDAGQPL